MKGRKRLAVFAILGALCASAQAQAPASPADFDRGKFEGYKPTDQVLGRLNAERALDILREIAGQKPKSAEVRDASGMSRLMFFVERKALSAFRPVGNVRKIEILEDRIEVDLDRQDRGPTTYYFHELPASLEIVHDYIMQDHYGVPLTPEWYLWCTDGGLFEDNRAGCAKLIAESLYVLRKASENMQTDDEKFKDVVAEYRKLGPKPKMPEEVRKYQVQADFMISQKRYGDAIRIYTEGLKSAPWWPDGRFNRALLFAETKRYRDAILDMNRFLMLEPESPDARSARDRIYQWEAAMKMRVR
jgi:tetratricopeptide (TPR) repeat protein